MVAEAFVGRNRGQFNDFFINGFFVNPIVKEDQ